MQHYTSGLVVKARARRCCWASLGLNVVSTIPSGFHTLSCKYAPKHWPDTFSTTAPSTSIEKPHSNAVPGWWANGNLVMRSMNSECP